MGFGLCLNEAHTALDILGWRVSKAEYRPQTMLVGNTAVAIQCAKFEVRERLNLPGPLKPVGDPEILDGPQVLGQCVSGTQSVVT